MASFGGAIKLTGADEYKRSLKQATQSLRECGSELRAVTSSFDKNDKSAESLEAQQKALNAVLGKQKETMSSLQSQYDSFSKKVEEQRAKHAELEAEYKKATAELQKIEGQSGKTSQAWQAQNKVVQEAQTAYHNSQVAMDANEKGLSDLAVKLNNAKTAVNTTSKEIDNLGNETEESGKQAEKAGEGFTVLKGILANLGTQAINTALAGVKKLGSTFVEVGKQALNSYADYEQLVGGVDTLFGDASKEVQKNASNAYKTAGLSANEYMDTVTSFSASLLQGLNGDTAKAAKIADQAIVDMSDNANKMGTDMTMIQNAYQGFAKQNYTMLDNLKLGYGGTASEMARLVNDSGVLGDSVKVTAKTINSVSYD